MIYSELYRVLWRRRLLVGLGTLLCVVLALAVTMRQEKMYTATATVRVEPSGDSSANDRFEASQRLSRSYAEIYTQGALIPKMSRLMAPARRPFKKELAAAQVKDLDLLAISGVSTSPRRAALIANTGARALEGFSNRERLALITPATVPTSPSSPNLPMNVALALVAGFILTAGLALVINAVVQPIADPDNIEDELDAPLLVAMPRLSLKRPRHGAPEAAPVRPPGGRQAVGSRRSVRQSGSRS